MPFFTEHVLGDGFIDYSKEIIEKVCENQDHLFDYLKQEIHLLGFSCVVVNQKNIVAWCDTGRVGRNVLVRALVDVDKQAQVMILLASMEKFKHMCTSLSGTVYFCFEWCDNDWQNANAEKLLSFLQDKNINTALGFYCSEQIEVGKLSVVGGCRLAGVHKVSLKVQRNTVEKTKGALVNNPIYVASNILMNLGGAMLDRYDEFVSNHCGISTVIGGFDLVMIKDDAMISGDIYYESEKEVIEAEDLIRNVSEHTAAMFDCCVEFNQELNQKLPPVIANETCCAFLKHHAFQFISPENFVDTPCEYAPNTFGVYAKLFPSVYPFIGFKMNESNLEHSLNDVVDLGVKLTLNYLLSLSLLDDVDKIN